MIIHKITSSVDFSEFVKHLDTQLNEPINQNVLEVPQKYQANE